MFMPVALLAAPSISSVSGTISHGQTITITGTSFGTHAKYSTSQKNYLCRFYDDFESGSINYTSGNWDAGSSDDASIVTNVNRPGSTYSVRQGNRSGGIGHEADGSQTKLYVSAWRYIGSQRTVPDYTNQKWFRFWKPNYGTPDLLFMLYDSEWTQGTVVYYMENASDANKWFDYMGTHLNSWHHYEVWVDKGNVVRAWYDGQLVEEASNVNWSTWTCGTTMFDFFHANMSGQTTGYAYLDDAYISHTQARVMIGNASTFGASNHREIQVPSAWGTSSISVKFNKGSYLAGETVYLYVIDENGAVNSAGYPVTIGQSQGSSADTTSPVIQITGPTTNTTYQTTSSSVAISGTSSDNVGVTSVSWTNNRGGSGSASGTTSWSVSGIALLQGDNIITATARDAAGNTANDSITITYSIPDATPPTQPSGVTIQIIQ